MNVETIRIDQLSADPANLRTHSEAQIEKLMASLRRWGQTLPLLADQNNVVRIGNARLDAMRRLGWTECKVVRLDLPPSEWVALAVADNRLHDLSEFNEPALTEVLAALRAEDVDMSAVGFSPDELAALLNEQNATDEQPPGEFKAFDETIPTNCKCPKCGFEWSDGKK